MHRAIVTKACEVLLDTYQVLPTLFWVRGTSQQKILICTQGLCADMHLVRLHSYYMRRTLLMLNNPIASCRVIRRACRLSTR